MTAEKLYKEALKLDPLSRSLLTTSLLENMEPAAGEELSEEWKAELDARLTADDLNPEEGISWDELRKTLSPKRKKSTVS